MLRRRPSGIDHQARTFNAKFACFRVIKVFKNEHNWNPFQCKEFLLVLFTKINYLKLFFPFQCTESASVLFKSTAKEERCLQASPRSSSSYVARCFVNSYPFVPGIRLDLAHYLLPLDTTFACFTFSSTFYWLTSYLCFFSTLATTTVTLVTIEISTLRREASKGQFPKLGCRSDP